MSNTPAAIVEIIPSASAVDDFNSYRPAVGDYATFADEFRRPGNATDAKIWKVEKLPTGRSYNVVLSDPEGGRGMRAPGYYLRKATDEEAAKAAAVVPVEQFYAGAVARIAGPGWKQPTDAVYVVLGDSTKGGYKVAVLGNTTTRYWTHVPKAFLTRVDPATIIVP